MVLVFENVGERSTVENYHAVSILSVVNKVFENLVNNRIVNHLDKSAFFLISSMVLGLLDRLQVFLQLYLIELLGLLTSLGLIKLWHLTYPIFLAGFGLQVFLTNVSLMLDGNFSQEYSVNVGIPACSWSYAFPTIH